MSEQKQPRCLRCKRFLSVAGQRHVCAGELDRCANPRCRRLLPVFSRRRSGYCARCEVTMALGQGGHGSGQPVNTGRPRRRAGLPPLRLPAAARAVQVTATSEQRESDVDLAEVGPRRVRPAWRERLEAHHEWISRRLWGAP